MRRLSASFTSAVAGLLACGGSSHGATSFSAATGPAITTETAASENSGSTAVGGSTTTTAEGSASTSSAGPGTGDTLVLDMGLPDFGPPLPKGCQGKIDFMFVVSAAGTMKNQQARLLASFPAFMDAIEAQLPKFDVHIISADSDAIWPLDDCKYCTGESCAPQGSPPGCGAVLDQCDKKILGAGITFPIGEGASNRRCELFGGNRYIIDGARGARAAAKDALRRERLEEMRALAATRGGACESAVYISERHPLAWRCAVGHRWEAPAGNVRRRAWCPYCSGHRLTIADMQALIEKVGGTCLSERFIDVDTKLLWRCASGHEWMASPARIRRSARCPTCSPRLRAPAMN